MCDGAARNATPCDQNRASATSTLEILCTMKVGLISLKAGTTAGGIATYEKCLIEAIADRDQSTEYHVYCLGPVSRRDFAIDQSNFVFHDDLPRNRWLSLCWSLPRAMRRQKLDFFHVMFLPPLWSGLPFAFTAHGPEMFIDPKFFPFKIRIFLLPLIKRCYRKASLIMCVSADTRDHVVAFRPDTERRSRVVYNGCLDIFKPQDPGAVSAKLQSRFKIEYPYALAVGRIEPRKNPIKLLEAFALFKEQSKSPVRLVLAGGRTWSAAEASQTIDRLGIASDVVSLDHVDHTDLPTLYAGARMLVFPTLWEGFGLPLIEAMRCGCPAITSDVSCMPEVAGGAAALIDPDSAPSIADAMVRIHTDEGYRDELIEKGLARASEFSWDRCAKETIEGYHDLARQLGCDH